MRVTDIMNQPIVTVREDATLEEVARVMLVHHVWGFPVVNDRGEITGIITDADFAIKQARIPFSRIRAPQLFGNWIGRDGIRNLYEAARTLKVRDVMSSPVVTITEDEPLENAIHAMGSSGYKHIAIVRGAVPVGIISRSDLLKLIARNGSISAL